MTEKALAYLGRDPVFYADMLLPIRRNTASILAAGEDGVLLFERASSAWFLAASSPGSAREMMDLVDGAELMAVHQDFSVEEACGRFGLRPTLACYQAAWLLPDPPEAAPSPLEYRTLYPDMADTVRAIYTNSVGMEYIRGRLLAGELFGAFWDGDLAGFIGLHEEGAMGMLEVLPAFRRRGVGSQLIAFLCHRQLARGLVPYSQFTRDNTPSRLLHQQMGFSISPGLVYWLEP